MSVFMYGLTVTGIGMLFVFAGLAILIALLMLMAQVFKKLDKKKDERQVEVSNLVAQEPPAEVEFENAEADMSQDELIAVIAAAIAAYDGGSKNLVVKSVRRVSGWKNAARTEQVYKF